MRGKLSENNPPVTNMIITATTPFPGGLQTPAATYVELLMTIIMEFQQLPFVKKEFHFQCYRC